MKPLKIGILLDPARELMDYEAQIFSQVFNDDRYEVLCTIKDGRKTINKQSMVTKLSNYFSPKTLRTLVLSCILDFFEKQLLKKKGVQPTDKTEIIARISTLPCIEMFPQRQEKVDVFSKEDCAKIDQLHLDVLLKHEFSTIQGEILKLPKYGVWSLQPGDPKVIRGYPGGFWEVYNNCGVTGVTLRMLDNEIDNPKIIAAGYFNTENFWYLNFENALDGSVDLLLKQLRLIYEGESLQTYTSGVYSHRPYRFPTFLQASNYMLRKYAAIACQEVKKLLYKAAKVESNKDVWKLHIGQGYIENAVLWQTKTIEPPTNEYWADPFLFEYDKKTYVFFENWEYARKKGKISVGVFSNGQLTDIRDCLDLDYHLSYPFVFEYKKQIYMIPESGQKKRLEIWRCDDFPDKWSLEKTCFEDQGRSIVDSTIAQDTNNQFWLFANFGSRKLLDHGSNLCVFKIDNPLMNEITPHKLNPVVSDCRSARNAGNIYIDKQGRLIRPSQASQNGIYGECFNLCHIKKLTIDTYEEEILETITPTFKKGLYSTHHVSQAGGLFIVDGGYKNR